MSACVCVCVCKCVCVEEVWLRVGLPCKICLPGGIAFAEVVDGESLKGLERCVWKRCG